ncbi:MAG TPA: FAD-binding protein, partial [Flavobacterium sp.]|nr:FAD-binding protein [Flavobacterium sp.]
ALRGQGAHIVNQRGKRFVFRDDPRGELATRDVVSASIFKEIQESGHPVYLDCRDMDRDKFGRHFPGILSYLHSRGIDPFEDLLPIIPVAHYQCGGVSVDTNG